MKIKNKRIYSDDSAYLERLADELEFIGRPYKLDLKNGVLTQFALPLRHKKSKETPKKEARNKRAESAGRRNRD